MTRPLIVRLANYIATAALGIVIGWSIYHSVVWVVPHGLGVMP